MRKIITVLAFGLLLCSAYYVYQWESAPVNMQRTMSMHESIHNGVHARVKIDFFDVHYVEHSPSASINPGFPSIHISTDVQHNAWLHVVYTDAYDPKNGKKGWVFIDALPDTFPFYSLEKDFYDAPLWTFSFFKGPLSSWEGHAYPVFVDYDNKTIQYLGGIGWGFTLSRFSFRPKTIKPHLLLDADWQQDWLMLRATEFFKNYQQQ